MAKLQAVVGVSNIVSPNLAYTFGKLYGLWVFWPLSGPNSQQLALVFSGTLNQSEVKFFKISTRVSRQYLRHQ